MPNKAWLGNRRMALFSHDDFLSFAAGASTSAFCNKHNARNDHLNATDHLIFATE